MDKVYRLLATVAKYGFTGRFHYRHRAPLPRQGCCFHHPGPHLPRGPPDLPRAQARNKLACFLSQGLDKTQSRIKCRISSFEESEPRLWDLCFAHALR